MDYKFDPAVFQPSMNEIQSYSKQFSKNKRKISVKKFFTRQASLILVLLLPLLLPPRVQASINRDLPGNFEHIPAYASSETNFTLKKVNSKETKLLNSVKETVLNGSNTSMEKNMAPISISSKSKKLEILKTNKKFAGLVGLGFSVQGSDTFPANNTIRNEISTQLNETINALKPISQQTLNHLWTPQETDRVEKLLIALKEGFLRHLSNLTELADLEFLPAHELEQDENLSGIIAKTTTNEGFALTRAEFLTEHPNPQEEGEFDLSLIRAFIKLEASIRNPIVRRLNFFSNFPETYNPLVEKLEALETQLNSLNLAKPDQTVNFAKSYSIGTLQVYSKTVPILGGFNAAFSYTIQDKNIHFGLGKAYFRPFSDRALGLIAGFDSGVMFRRAPNRFLNYSYGGLAVKGFIGIGVAV